MGAQREHGLGLELAHTLLGQAEAVAELRQRLRPALFVQTVAPAENHPLPLIEVREHVVDGPAHGVEGFGARLLGLTGVNGVTQVVWIALATQSVATLVRE